MSAVHVPEFTRVRNGVEHVVPAYDRRPREPFWSREKIIEALRLWNDLFGEAPRCADWNPSMARSLKRRNGKDSRTQHYESGNWPSAATVQRTFGTWTGALIAAGLRPHRVGPRAVRPRLDVIDQAEVEGAATPLLIVRRTKAALEAHQAGDIDALRSALTDLAASALAWRDVLPAERRAA